MGFSKKRRNEEDERRAREFGFCWIQLGLDRRRRYHLIEKPFQLFRHRGVLSIMTATSDETPPGIYKHRSSARRRSDSRATRSNISRWNSLNHEG